MRITTGHGGPETAYGVRRGTATRPEHHPETAGPAV